VLDQRTVDIVRTIAAELRRRGEEERAAAVETVLHAALLASPSPPTAADQGAMADLVGVDGQTLRRWVEEGRYTGYRAGPLAVPREIVEEYVRRARTSLDLDSVPDEEAARLVAEGRRRE
jgi:hypothetical protein